MYCETNTPRCHQLRELELWSIVLLESEEVSCYGTNRRQKVLTEQDVTVISAINFTPDSMNISSVVPSVDTATDTMTVAETTTVAITSLPVTLRAVSKLIGKPILHKSCIVNGKIGVRDFKYVEKMPPTHTSCDTAHAQWLQTHCEWYPMGDVRTHSSTTDGRRIFKLGGGVDHVTRHV